MNALKRNSKLEMTYFPTKDVFDASILKNKFEEFLNNPDDPKWEKIADAGRKYAINNFNNDKACNSLVSLMETMIQYLLNTLIFYSKRLSNNYY